MASKTKLTKADYIKTGLRAYYIQNGFNYGNYQGLGYANMLFPALKKMYKGDDDALQAALQDNIEFYNTNLHFVPFITSLHLSMLENDANPDSIRQIVLQADEEGKLVFPGEATGLISVFCMGSDATGVTLQGLKYELNDGVLTGGHPLGLSNAFVGKIAMIEVKNGSLLVLWDGENGYPIR